MIDLFLKNKELSLFALIGIGMYAYGKYLENEKLSLEIKLLKEQAEPKKTTIGNRLVI